MIGFNMVNKRHVPDNAYSVHHVSLNSLKLVSAIFTKFLFFHQMIALQNLLRNVFYFI